MDGNVVGVNSVIYSSGGSVGIAFSIPSNLVREVMAQLRQYGGARRGWVGVRIQQVTDDIAEGLGLPSTHGALIADVTPNGPAARGGMQHGDFGVGFDGRATGFGGEQSFGFGLSLFEFRVFRVFVGSF